MIFASSSTVAREIEPILDDLVQPVHARLGDASVDLVIAFFSPHFTRQMPRMAYSLRNALSPHLFLACTGEAVVGPDHELEDRPAAALMAASLPGIELSPFALQRPDWMDIADGLLSPRRFVGNLADPRLFIMLADPFSTPADAAIEAFNTTWPGVPVVGGLVSGSGRPGGNVLVLNGNVLVSGAVGVALSGPVQVDIVLSQGCRPIGRPFKVTEASDNIIYMLDDGSPLEQVESLVASLPERDRNLMENGFFIGRAVNPGKGGLGRGDFLIRSVLGADRENGSLKVGDRIPVGEIVQFQVRDAVTAQEDLSLVLTPQTFFDAPRGALLFACNSRGTRLYGHPDGDIAPIQSVLGGVPLAGFFCAGELAPLAGHNAVHGHTACLALFREPSDR